MHTLQKCDFSKNALRGPHHFCARNKQKKDPFEWCVTHFKEPVENQHTSLFIFGKEQFHQVLQEKIQCHIMQGSFHLK